MKISGEHIIGQEIIIDDGKTRNSIKPDAILEDCTLRLRVPSNKLMIRGTLINTTISMEKKNANYYWFYAKLIQCTFIGTIVENNFGPVGDFDGKCESCDFSNAKLESCQFFGDSVESHIYPSWPYLTIINPLQNLDTMISREETGNMPEIVDALEYANKELRAIVYNANMLAKRHDIDVETIKQFFSQFPFVRM